MIRPLSSTDRAPVMEMLRATHVFNEPEVDIACELMDTILTQPEQTDYYGFVDETASSVAGLLILGPVPATVGSWHMYWIAVHPEFHGTGVAQALDRWAESFVRERNGYWLIAETSGQPSYERTRAFYKKQGYTILAQIPDYYRPADDLVLLGKRL